MNSHPRLVVPDIGRASLFLTVFLGFMLALKALRKV